MNRRPLQPGFYRISKYDKNRIATGQSIIMAKQWPTSAGPTMLSLVFWIVLLGGTATTLLLAVCDE
jgi:hypothetical protein